MISKNTYYLFNPGRMSRKDNTLKVETYDEKGEAQAVKYIPVEGVTNLYIFGSVDANSALFNFLGKKKISVHFFDYYEHYTGSFMPKEFLLAGKLQVEQTKAYLQSKRRMHLAHAFVEGASGNILRILKYYNNRGKELGKQIERIENLRESVSGAKDVPTLMGIEGNCRQEYYTAFDEILIDFEMGGRSKRPPKNEINALISFGNMVCYTQMLDAIYHTPLNPTISFLHEPGARRYSLALDLSEIFKPILVDRTIFSLINRKEIQAKHFENALNGCFLNEKGKKIFLKAFEERLKETFKHRGLNRNVSYKYLLRLECYKLVKYILKIDEQYKPFQLRW